MAQHYKDLIAWQKAMDLVEEIYRITEQFPKREVYSLTDQIRRAAVSIPSNIAEGQAHYSKREFTHYLRHARGSLAELETQVRAFIDYYNQTMAKPFAWTYRGTALTA